MKTLTEQYRLIKNDKGHKGVFLKEAKRIYPNLLTNSSTFNEASKILKSKGIINENFVGLAPINNPFGDKKQEGYETAFENFIKEATEVKSEEKKVSKEVEEDQDHAYDTKDKKDPNNMIFSQIQTGVYFEAKQEKNTDKTLEQIKDIVYKNLEKDPIYYTTHGQFGIDVGYTNEAPSLGEPKEPKGPYKSSGYGTLKENKKPISEIAIAGGIVTGTGFVGMNYRDYYSLEEEANVDAKAMADEVERARDAAKELDTYIEEDGINEDNTTDGFHLTKEQLMELSKIRKELIKNYNEGEVVIYGTVRDIDFLIEQILEQSKK